MKNSKQQILMTLVTLGAVALLTGCGSSNTAGNSDQSSRLPTDTSSATKALAYCNQGTGTEVSMKLQAFKDASGNYRNDYMYAKITAVPSSFAGGTSYISMWKWLANTTGNAQLDNTPLNFAIMSKTGQGLTAWMTVMRWSDIMGVASSLGYSDPQTLFANTLVLIDLKDPNGEYDVLKVTNYNSSTNAAISSLDVLLPIFYANPADYALEPNGQGRAQVLQRLHPFKANLGQGYSASQFQSMANNFCL